MWQVARVEIVWGISAGVSVSLLRVLPLCECVGKGAWLGGISDM